VKRITVLLVDDHTILREGIRKLIGIADDIEVVGEAQDGREAVAMVKKLHPAVVLMDIAMPLLNGLEATRQALRAAPATKVLILSAHSDDAYVKHAAESGAVGFLTKLSSADDICVAIREARNGKTIFSPAVSRRLNRLDRESHGITGLLKKRVAHLTSREVEVLQLIAEGKANKQTAVELGVGIKTAEKHRENLMHKLDIHDTAGLTRYAIAAGIVESSVQLTVV
jgi:DNA-binding NarL/FixJ family response regulator